MYEVGATRLFFTRCQKNPPGVYDKEQIGLNHLAFGVRTLEELRVIQTQLTRAGILHSEDHNRPVWGKRVPLARRPRWHTP